MVFLDFGKGPQTAEFFQLLESLQATLSHEPSILWYQYFDGIGSELFENDQSCPMSFSGFCRRLSKDEPFRLFYDQLFQFLRRLKEDEYHELLSSSLTKLQEIKMRLADGKIVPGITPIHEALARANRF